MIIITMTSTKLIMISIIRGIMIIMIIVIRIRIVMVKIQSHEPLKIRHSDVLILMLYQYFIENSFIEFQVFEIFDSSFGM